MISIPADFFDHLLKIFLAAILGGLIGFERDIHGRAAGLRTHLLVCVGACVFMILSIDLVKYSPNFLPKLITSADPGRIAAQVVTGIGFLGAGAIIKEGFTIRGLTTAACLWVDAAIGMTVGAGFYAVAVMTTVIALVALIIFNYFEKLYRRDIYRILSIKTALDTDLNKLVSCINAQNVKITSINLIKNYEDNFMNFDFSLIIFHKGLAEVEFQKISSAIEKEKIFLKKIKWTQL